MKRMSWLAIAALAVAATVQAAPRERTIDPPVALARLDGFAQGMTRADAFAGVVLVAVGDRVVFERGYGKRDAAKDDAITPATRFDLASAGKMFTSVAVWQQIAAGRLSLSTRVGEVLPDYRNRAFREQVTVAQLLTHKAGAGDIDLFGTENAANRARIHNVADMVALHDDRAPTFTPGSKQDYSNFGFVVLGRMVERVSGEAYEAYVARHIFAPAGMTRTLFVDCAARPADAAVGYAKVEGKKVGNCATQPGRGMPAGGELSTARDMFRFVAALRGGRLLPPARVAQATRTVEGPFGYGFFATGYGKDVPLRDFRWGHGGSGDGMCVDVRHYPRTGETVVVLANIDPPGCYPVANFLHDQVNAARG